MLGGWVCCVYVCVHFEVETWFGRVHMSENRQISMLLEKLAEIPENRLSWIYEHSMCFR